MTCKCSHLAVEHDLDELAGVTFRSVCSICNCLHYEEKSMKATGVRISVTRKAALLKLFCEFGDACFDCGEWRQDGDGPDFEVLVDAQSEAYKEFLRELEVL